MGASMSEWPWPAPVDDGGAAHLAPGQAVPDIALPATMGPPVSLAKEPWRVIAFFYPWSGRPGAADPPGWDSIAGAHGSTAQAEGFRDRLEDYALQGIRVVGISTQEPAWQEELAARLDLPFALLSDSRSELARALRLPTFETGGATYLTRLTLVLRGGRIERVVYPVHPPDRHAADLLAILGAGAAPP